MNKIDLFKTKWEAIEWAIYLTNLEILCKREDIKKQELSEKSGIINAFRTDIKKPSPETIEKIANTFGVKPEWLLTRHDAISTLHDPEKPYDHHGGWKPRSIEEMVGVPSGLGMGRAVEMLARIYQSKNQMVIRAIFSNLQVFTERVDQEDEITQLKQDMAELRAEGEKREKEMGELRALFQAQVDAVTSGPDRRSGLERRQSEGIIPGGLERRSGEDRREGSGDGEKDHG